MIYNLSVKTEAQTASDKLKKLIKKGAFVEITEKRPKKTVQQNKYIHVCLQILAKETGYTVAELKSMFQNSILWLSYEITDMFTGKSITHFRGISDLSDIEAGYYIDFVRKTASEIGCYIPTPDEYYENQLLIDSELQKEGMYQ